MLFTQDTYHLSMVIKIIRLNSKSCDYHVATMITQSRSFRKSVRLIISLRLREINVYLAMPQNTGVRNRVVTKVAPYQVRLTFDLVVC
jgi:hypothetical protein